MSLPAADPTLTDDTCARAQALLARYEGRIVDLPSRYWVQMAHLTTPATVWRYVEGACTRSRANLVMLDLEDSTPRGDGALLDVGRGNIVHALRDLDWGPRLRFFRPRGLALDPEMIDLSVIVAAAGDRLDGIVWPKAESADELRLVDDVLSFLEARHGLPAGALRVCILIESVTAEEEAFAIAAASRRVAALVFGAFDWWSSLGMIGVDYRYNHPLVDRARARIARAAASVGVPAIAEMTLSYPTADKSEEERRLALDECRRDARHARWFGFRGKWVGIPAQVDVVIDAFALSPAVVEEAVAAVRAFREAERAGRGATMISGKMADRATDRVHRVALRTAVAMKILDPAVAEELGI